MVRYTTYTKLGQTSGLIMSFRLLQQKNTECKPLFQAYQQVRTPRVPSGYVTYGLEVRSCIRFLLLLLSCDNVFIAGSLFFVLACFVLPPTHLYQDLYTPELTHTTEDFTVFPTYFTRRFILRSQDIHLRPIPDQTQKPSSTVKFGIKQIPTEQFYIRKIQKLQ